MDELWRALRSVHVKTNPDASRRRTDRNYAKDLQILQAEDRWRAFYRAIDALERGCGYRPFPELEALCKRAIPCDERQFLQILADEPAMMDIVMILRCADSRTMLRWIETEMISNVNVLFECLREIFRSGPLPEEAQNAAAKGLLQLCALSPERFQYMLQTGPLFRDEWVGTVRAVLPHLTEAGWSGLSGCISFEGMNGRHFRFWSECALNQDWSAVGRRAEPLLQAWYKDLERAAAEGRVWESLYNEASNLLIGALLSRMDTPGDCERAMEGIIVRTEEAMFQWYERSLQQSGTLLAGLSQLEHLRFVRLNLGEDAPPSAALCRRALKLISRWRHLWFSPSDKGICEGIGRLEEWLGRTASGGKRTGHV